ncbi:uncharacterized protein conserved in archaea [Cenarchaeum symbiosum A]|uniref:Uncharacterized protein conserved in archaea n=1 Tax=Cenarchaeum symbiosum (strain A) TaxID=414004 RepID=A0RYP7_CENSY|nr:uncharacterized protein conserved in archaea [Cenarchaeum symbiosum A]
MKLTQIGLSFKDWVGMAGLEVDASLLYSIVLREVQSDAAQELDPGIYRAVSEYLGKLRHEEYEGTEKRIKDATAGMVGGLASYLLMVRLEKAAAGGADHANLLDEEKFIVHSQEEMGERRGVIESGILSGRPGLLESVAQKYKTRPVVVRFLQKTDRMMGADMESYGPFKAEDVAALPYENAQALISKKIADRVRWED